MANFKLWVKQYSPEILLGTSIVSTVGSVVLGCIATEKLHTKNQVSKMNIVRIHEHLEKVKKEDPNNVEKINELNKRLKDTYRKMAWRYVKAYAPCVLSLGVSIASMCCSHKIMKVRNVALASALTLAQTALNAYRDRVKEAIGEEAEKVLFEGLKGDKVKIETKEGKKVETTIKDDNAPSNNMYEIWWGVGNSGYDNEHPGLSISYLQMIERECNQMLMAKGHLFLCDVFSILGVYDVNWLGKEKMRASHVLGWKYDRNNPNIDSYISFGLTNPDGSSTESAKLLQMGSIDTIKLKFNVDGDILRNDDDNFTSIKKED